MAPIYRADQVGSLLRPAELLEARRNPDISHDELPGIEDRHILDVLDRQKRAGFKIFTDGELRRTGFMGDFYESVEGLKGFDGSVSMSLSSPGPRQLASEGSPPR